MKFNYIVHTKYLYIFSTDSRMKTKESVRGKRMGEKRGMNLPFGQREEDFFVSYRPFKQVARVIVDNRLNLIPVGFIEVETRLPHREVNEILDFFQEKNFINIDGDMVKVNPDFAGTVF